MAKVQLNFEILAKKELEDFREGIKEWRNQLRLAELEFKKNNVTVAEYKEIVKRAADVLEYFEDGSGRTAAAQNALWHANNRVELGFKSLATETVQANRALKEINQEQKLGNAILGRLAGVLGGDAAGIIGQFQRLEDGTLAGSVALKQMGGSAGALGASLAAMATPIAAAVAAIGAMITWTNNFKDSVKTLKEELYALDIALGKVSKERQYQDMLDKLAELKSKPGDIPITDNLFSLLTGAGAPMMLNAVAMRAGDQKVKEIRELELKIEQFRKSNFQQYGPAIVVDKPKKGGGGSVGGGGSRGADVSGFYTNITGTWTGSQGQTMGGGVDAPRRLSGVIPPEFSSAEAIDAVYKRGGESVMEFASMARNSFVSIGYTITNSIGGAFDKAFGIGHTLLGQFIRDMGSQLASAAMTWGFTSLLSLIPGVGPILQTLGYGVKGHASGGVLDEPVFGIGTRTGQAYSFAEREPEYIVNQRQMGTLLKGGQRSGQPVIVNVRGDFKYDKLAFAVDRGNQLRSLRK